MFGNAGRGKSVSVKGDFIDDAVEIISVQVFMDADEKAAVGRLGCHRAGSRGHSVDIPSPGVSWIIEDERSVMDLSHDRCRAAAACRSSEKAADVAGAV